METTETRTHLAVPTVHSPTAEWVVLTALCGLGEALALSGLSPPSYALQHGTLGSGRSSDKGPSWSSRSLGARCRNSIASCPEEQPHVGNYRLLRTIGKGNFAKVKLARHILTGREHGTLGSGRSSDKGPSWSSRSLGARCRNSIASCPEEQPHVGNYRLLRTIGKGNFAKVKLARHILTGREVAIKIIDKTQLNPSSLQKLFREVRIMKGLNHPNIVKLFEVIETEKTLYLVMEYASAGEVFDYLVSHGRMKEKEARAKFRQVRDGAGSRGLYRYCHKKTMVHRDLKAENLLLDAEANIKIADFGFSNEFTLGSKLDTFCGSPPYAAPELFQGKKYDGPEVDIWSLGVILYTLVSGSLPFDGHNLKELRERVLRGKYRVPFYMSTDCESILRRFLVLNPAKRCTLEQIMKDKWINIGYEGEELKPYTEPEEDFGDTKRIEVMVGMGYTREEIKEALTSQKYNEVTATYLLLGRKTEEGGDRGAPGLALARVRAPSDTTNGTSSSKGTSHSKGQRSSSSTYHRQRRHSDFCGPSPAPLHPKRSPTSTGEAELKEERLPGRKASCSAAGSGSRGLPPSSPMVSSAHNPNKAEIPERRKDSASTPNNLPPSMMTRRNTYVCTERPGAERPSLLPNGKENRVADESERIGGPEVTSCHLPWDQTETAPRLLRFPWSVKLTSSRPPEALMAALRQATAGARCTCRQLLACLHGGAGGPEPLSHFEVEVCQLPRPGLRGVLFRRVAGTALAFRTLVTRISNDLEL
ncbi:MAP/microtubule affinity-regulating kinase 4 [Tupaia chinensis]|uniref:Serine/threonine-protein kinase SIK3 n=1 Tax=Tupaia chinensis TaxID=246437 RepID=L9LBJ0_TUPCH|nr:MAP/microtubule affinity-regulating kinase 4 [Tupaia chinensis]